MPIHRRSHTALVTGILFLLPAVVHSLATVSSGHKKAAASSHVRGAAHAKERKPSAGQELPKFVDSLWDTLARKNASVAALQEKLIVDEVTGASGDTSSQDSGHVAWVSDVEQAKLSARAQLIEDIARNRLQARKDGEKFLKEPVTFEDMFHIHGTNFQPSEKADKPKALRPNIVWVMADDLGWGEPGWFANSAGAEGRRIDTPNMDKFGEEGVIFRQAYSGYPTGGPSRTSFFTGRHAGEFWRYGLDGSSITPIQGARTLPALLKKVGYQTGAFGSVQPFTQPLKSGFDTFLGQLDGSSATNLYSSAIDYGLGRGNVWLSNQGASREECLKNPNTFNYTIDVIHREAMNWLSYAAKQTDPFFLYLSYTLPHAGTWEDIPSSEAEGQPVPTQMHYADKDWPEVEKDHAAAVSYLDLKLGDLMQHLSDLNIDEDTLVIFASDNGAHEDGAHTTDFFKASGNLRGKKGMLYEGGVRSPTIARWPGAIPQNQVSDFVWAFWDVLPTIAELAGFTAPQKLEGVSIVPTLFGRKQDAKEYVYFTGPSLDRMPDEQNFNMLSTEQPKHKSGYAIRVGSWKAVVRSCSDVAGMKPSERDTMELYNLRLDPGETQDVAASNANILSTIQQYLVEKRFTCACFQCDWNE